MDNIEEISREDTLNVEEHGASAILYNDPTGKRYGIEIFSLKKGNRLDKVIFSTTADMDKEIAERAGGYVIKRIKGGYHLSL